MTLKMVKKKLINFIKIKKKIESLLLFLKND